RPAGLPDVSVVPKLGHRIVGQPRSRPARRDDAVPGTRHRAGRAAGSAAERAGARGRNRARARGTAGARARARRGGDGHAVRAGPIVFVGLVVPYLARMITGPDYRWLLPYSTVLAATLLLVADVVGRVIVRPSEVAVGVTMAFVGAPVLIAMIRRRGRLPRL